DCRAPARPHLRGAFARSLRRADDARPGAAWNAERPAIALAPAPAQDRRASLGGIASLLVSRALRRRRGGGGVRPHRWKSPMGEAAQHSARRARFAALALPLVPRGRVDARRRGDRCWPRLL